MSNLVLQDDSSVACLLRRGDPTTASLCSRSLRPTWRISTKRLRENAVVSPEDRLARVSIFCPNWIFGFNSRLVFLVPRWPVFWGRRFVK